MSKYFYDSYAVLAYISDRPGYAAYFEDNDGVLTKLNLMEIFYRSLTVHGSKAATRIIEAFSRYLIDFDLNDIKGSMKLRRELKDKGFNLSYADALGYYLASKLGINFLTGDRVFEGLDNVEFRT